jgi:hypothetical protein
LAEGVLRTISDNQIREIPTSHDVGDSDNCPRNLTESPNLHRPFYPTRGIFRHREFFQARHPTINAKASPVPSKGVSNVVRHSSLSTCIKDDEITEKFRIKFGTGSIEEILCHRRCRKKKHVTENEGEEKGRVEWGFGWKRQYEPAKEVVLVDVKSAPYRKRHNCHRRW